MPTRWWTIREMLLRWVQDPACVNPVFRSTWKYISIIIGSRLQGHLMSYDTDMPVEQMVKRLCDLKQGYTQFGGRSISSSPFLAHFLLFFSYLASRSNPKFGVLILGQRPFGVSFLIAGYDPHHQFQVSRTVQRSKVYPPPPLFPPQTDHWILLGTVSFIYPVILNRSIRKLCSLESNLYRKWELDRHIFAPTRLQRHNGPGRSHRACAQSPQQDDGWHKSQLGSRFVSRSLLVPTTTCSITMSLCSRSGYSLMTACCLNPHCTFSRVCGDFDGRRNWPTSCTNL
jgi:hypothetical protein